MNALDHPADSLSYTADEIQELRKEAEANKALRASLREEGAAKRVFEKVRCARRCYRRGSTDAKALQVYATDIARLLKMEDMWKHRKAPHVLSYDDLSTSVTQKTASAETSANGAAPQGIKDQRALSLTDSFELFVSRCEQVKNGVATRMLTPTPQR